MKVYTVHEALIADKSALTGQAIKYHDWINADFDNFNYFITWVNFNFDYKLLCVGQTLIFFIVAQLSYTPVNQLKQNSL